MTQDLRARVYLVQGHATDALQLARSAARNARQAQLPRDEGWALLTQGHCERAMSRESKATKAFNEALEHGKIVHDIELVVQAREAIQ